ncbi:MAG: universal stress protein [Woeseiaceae bacterium]|nr:universal stress protein [Woeseiaceae bacterium]
MKMLVGYDGSEFAKRALARAVTLAGTKGSVTIASVIASDSQASEMVSQQRLLSDAKSLAGKRKVETLELSGNAAEALMKAASKLEADFLVVGSRGRGAAASLLLGSVSATLAREAPCDVIIVR